MTIRQSLVLLASLCACSPLLNAQAQVHHAPTVEQCRADQKLWFSKLEQHNEAGVADVSYNDLAAWGNEMVDCMGVDPESANGYYNTLEEAYAERVTRTETFINRHNLYGQFLAEDAQGKR